MDIFHRHHVISRLRSKPSRLESISDVPNSDYASLKLEFEAARRGLEAHSVYSVKGH